MRLIGRGIGHLRADVEKGSREEVFIIGGAALYKAALPLAKRMYMTLVDQEPTNADTFFPEFDTGQWRETEHEQHKGFAFTLWTLKK